MFSRMKCWHHIMGGLILVLSTISGMARASSVDIGGSATISRNVLSNFTVGYGGTVSGSILGPTVENIPEVTIQGVRATNGGRVHVNGDVSISDNQAKDITVRSGKVCAQGICSD